MLVPAHRRRRGDERLARDYLHAKTLGQLERRGALLGSHGPGRVRWFGNLRESEICGEQAGRCERRRFEDGSIWRRQMHRNQFVRARSDFQNESPEKGRLPEGLFIYRFIFAYASSSAG